MGSMQVAETVLGWKTKSDSKPMFDIPDIMENQVILRLYNGLNDIFKELIENNVSFAEKKLRKAIVFKRVCNRLFDELGQELWPDTAESLAWLNRDAGVSYYSSEHDRGRLRWYFREWVALKVANKRRNLRRLERAQGEDGQMSADEYDGSRLPVSDLNGGRGRDSTDDVNGEEAQDPMLDTTVVPEEPPGTSSSARQKRWGTPPVADMGTGHSLRDETLIDTASAQPSVPAPSHSPDRRQLESDLADATTSGSGEKRAIGDSAHDRAAKRARCPSQPLRRDTDTADDSPLPDIEDLIRRGSWRGTPSESAVHVNGVNVREDTATIAEGMANWLEDQFSADASAESSSKRGKPFSDNVPGTEQFAHRERSGSNTLEPEARTAGGVAGTQPHIGPESGTTEARNQSAQAFSYDHGAIRVDGEQPGSDITALKARFDARWIDFCSLKAKIQELKESRDAANESFKFNEGERSKAIGRCDELRSLLQEEESKCEAFSERLAGAQRRIDEADECLLKAGGMGNKFYAAVTEACDAFAHVQSLQEAAE